MIDPQEVEAIIDIVEARIHEHGEAKKPQQQRRHWPRRVVILAVVLGLGVLLHHFIESVGARSALQSAELALAALFDSIFSKAREV